MDFVLKRVRTITVSLVLVLSSANALAQEQSLRVAVDLVLVDVSVTDKAGHPVKNLRQDNFQIYEDKLEQPIRYFSTEESSVTWGLVLDRSGSMSNMKDVYEAAAAAGLLSPVSIATLTPSACSPSMASLALLRIWSRMAIIAHNCFSFPINATVLPSLWNLPISSPAPSMGIASRCRKR